MCFGDAGATEFFEAFKDVGVELQFLVDVHAGEQCVENLVVLWYGEVGHYW